MKTRIKQLFRLPALVTIVCLMPAGLMSAQTFSNLYSFTATHTNSSRVFTNSDGTFPTAGLILSGNTLYGTTSEGGANGNGTVFAVNIDGTGFTNLYSFTATVTNASGVYTNSDGASPQGGLVPVGDLLYGTASGGGTNGNGTVFELRTNGTGFTNLHNFTATSVPYYQGGTNSDGVIPLGGLVLAGFDFLYGTTQYGGTNGNGTVFAINVDGSGFTNLHSFTAYPAHQFTNSDGANPEGGLISAGNAVYGTTADGGAGGNGTVFAINDDGTGFTNLYSFSALSGISFNNLDGANPFAGLVVSGSMLYGTTHSGGLGSGGTVFGVSTSGTGFTNLHTFTGTNDGDNPYAGLALVGSTLFGTAGNGGKSFDGTLFAVNTSGVGFTIVHTFTNNPDGGSPHASLVLSGNTLYGTAEGGGTNGNGMVFSLTLPTPQLTAIRSGTNVIVTWPTNALEFTLQSTTNLGPTTVWTTVSPPPYAVISTNKVVTNLISGTNQFYRLSL